MFESRAADVVLCNLLFSISQVVIHACLPQVILLLVCQEMGLSGRKCFNYIDHKKTSLQSYQQHFYRTPSVQFCIFLLSSDNLMSWEPITWKQPVYFVLD